MVRLRWFYGLALLLSLVMAAAPATREAAVSVTGSLWNDIPPYPYAPDGGYLLERRVVLVADHADEPVLWAAAAAMNHADQAQARQLLAAGLARHPNDVILRRFRALFEVDLLTNAAGSPTRATAAVQAALEVEPGNALLWLTQAMVQTANGEPAAAYASLAEALRQPDFETGGEEVYRGVMRLHHRCGVGWLEAAMSSWPGPSTRRGLREMAESLVAGAGRPEEGGQFVWDRLMLQARVAAMVIRRADTCLLARPARSWQEAVFLAGDASGLSQLGPSGDDPAQRAARAALCERFAVRLEQAGRTTDAAWVRQQPELWQAVAKAEAERARLGLIICPPPPPSRGDLRLGQPMSQVALWFVLLRGLVWVGLALPLAGWLLFPSVPRPRTWLAWRWRQWWPLAVAATGPAAALAYWGVARQFRRAVQEQLWDGTPVACCAPLLGVAVLVLVGWSIGRSCRRPVGGTLGDARRLAARAMALPVLALQATLFILALTCLVPLAFWRARATAAFATELAFQRQVLREAIDELAPDDVQATARSVPRP